MQMNWVRRNRPHAVRRHSHGLRRTGWLVFAAAGRAWSPRPPLPPAARPFRVRRDRAAELRATRREAASVLQPAGVSGRLRRRAAATTAESTASGETVVVPELASSPPSMDIRKDLATFDSTFGLPPAKLHVVNTFARSKTPYLADDEEVEDTEMVHAIAPGATLAVVLLPQDSNPTARSSSQPRRPSSYGPALRCTRP